MALFGKKNKKKKGKKGDEDNTPDDAVDDEDAGSKGADKEEIRATKSGEDGEKEVGEDGEELDLEGTGKKSKKKLFIIIGAVVLLIAAGAGAYVSGLLDPILGKSADESSEHGDADGGDDGHGGKKSKKGEEGEGHTVAFMEIPDLVVNLSTTQGQPRYLKLKVQLELESAADQAAVEKIAPRVIDHFQTYLRELRVSDLRGSAGIYRLRQELLARVNAAVAPIEVKDVLFQEILIQ